MSGVLILLCVLLLLAVVAVRSVLLAVRSVLRFRKQSEETNYKVRVRKEKGPPKRGLPPAESVDHITVLSIDGGGIRGMIPAVILEHLEKRLQVKEKDDNARIADYFDVIAGTSTGALIAAMLTTPIDAEEIKKYYGDKGQPKYTIQEIKKYYKEIKKYYEDSGWPKYTAEAMKKYYEDNVRPKYTDEEIKKFYENDGRPKYTVEEMKRYYEDNGRPKYTTAEIIKCYQNNGRPKFTAAEIKEYYEKKGPRIFSPRYDCTFLREEIKDITGDTTLVDTLANVVVPTFDIRRLNTVSFSSFKRPLGVRGPQREPTLLSDVCIGTTAAPTYFPAHHFKAYRREPRSNPEEHHYTSDDELEHHHLIDGGVGANNPTMVAIEWVARRVIQGTRKTQPIAYKHLVVISIGTGSTRKKEVTIEDTKPDRATSRYTAKDCAKWGAIRWIVDWDNWGRKPIVDMLMQASDFLIDQQVATLLHIHGCKNYLRIQPLEVDESCISLDNTTNIEKLKAIGEDLLKDESTVYEVNQITGRYEEKIYKEHGKGVTKKLTEEIEEYASKLIEERNRRRNNNRNWVDPRPTNLNPQKEHHPSNETQLEDPAQSADQPHTEKNPPPQAAPPAAEQ